MFHKRLRFFLLISITLFLIFIIGYKISFYTPPLLDSGKRNFAEMTLDIFYFGWHFTKALIYDQYLNNSNSANKEFGKASWYNERYLIKRYRINGEDLISLIDLYKKLNIKPTLEKLYTAIIKEKNLNPDFLSEAGATFIACKNWEMAEVVFAKVIDLNPGDVMSCYYLGLSYLNLKKFSKANEYFERVIKLEPEFADAYYQIGLIAEKEHEWKKAKFFYEKAINMLPNHVNSLKALYRIYER